MSALGAFHLNDTGGRECVWPSCHSRDEVRPVRPEQGAETVAVCRLHRKNVLAVTS